MYKIEYYKPSVYLIKDNGISQSEIAARTCYDSFEDSDSELIRDFKTNKNVINKLKNEDISSSELLSKLSWTYFHHSILEHSVLTYYIKDMSRGVLQELARHRIASISVKSSRYTLSNILYAFALLSKQNNREYILEEFNKYLLDFETLNIADSNLHRIETSSIYHKLEYHMKQSNEEAFFSTFLAKDNLKYWKETSRKNLDINVFISNKAKRNAGDKFKYIVTDNFRTEVMWTINLRSLKNFIELRDSNSAWFQIRWLAKGIIDATPTKYLNLIMKEYK